jgi:hypothetical protein
MMAHKRKTRNNQARSRYDSTHRMFDDMLSLAGSLVSFKKDWVADRVSTLSSATHAYADALNDISGVGPYVNLTATSFDDFAQYLNESDFNDMLRDGSIFAKRHPVQTLAGAVIAGIIATQIYRIDVKSP